MQQNEIKKKNEMPEHIEEVTKTNIFMFTISTL